MLSPSLGARFERKFRWALAGALFMGLLAGVLIPRMAALAQAMEPQTYTVIAGDGTFYNTQVLAFAPQSLQVHRGDTIIWRITGGFHNVHFEEQPTDLIVAPEVNGEPLPQLNPAVLFPTTQDGAVYQGGEANTGVSFDPTNATFTFSMVMNVEPGTYPYFCDLHPGMLGNVTVVDDATAIPSPTEALAAAAAELEMQDGQGIQGATEASMQPATTSADGTLQVSVGLQVGAAQVFGFFPSVAVIQAGQSVTWTVPENSREPHFVASVPPPPPGSDFAPVFPDQGPPMVTLGPSAFPSVESGSAIGAGDSFNSGILFPSENYAGQGLSIPGLVGSSFTLKFTDPGVYNYLCFVHPGMNGVVVVIPAT